MENKWKLFNENQWEWINVCFICSFHGTNVETYTYQWKLFSNQSWFNITTCEHSLRKLGICRTTFPHPLPCIWIGACDFAKDGHGSKCVTHELDGLRSGPTTPMTWPPNSPHSNARIQWKVNKNRLPYCIQWLMSMSTSPISRPISDCWLWFYSPLYPIKSLGLIFLCLAMPIRKA